jgi:hypothetical protein
VASVMTHPMTRYQVAKTLVVFAGLTFVVSFGVMCRYLNLMWQLGGWDGLGDALINVGAVAYVSGAIAFVVAWARRL